MKYLCLKDKILLLQKTKNNIVDMKKVVFAAMILLAPSIMAQETQEDINKKTIDSLKSEVQALKEMMTLNIKK